MPLPPKKSIPSGPPLEIDFDKDVEGNDSMIIEKNKKKFDNWTFIDDKELEADEFVLTKI